MRFWITIVIGIVVVTALSTVMFVSNPDMQQRPPRAAEPASTQLSGDHPKAVTDTMEKKLENLPQAHQGKTSFEISNGGKAVLTLVPLKPSCTCAAIELVKETAQGKEFIRLKSNKDSGSGGFRTQVSREDLSEIQLAPGEKAECRVEYDTRSRLGRYSIAAPVRTNDPLKKQINFRLLLEVMRDVIVEPANLVFGRLSEGRPAKSTVWIYSTIHDNLQISDLTVSSKLLKVDTKSATPEELKKLPEAKSACKVIVSTDGTLPVGLLQERFTFKTNIERVAELSVGLSGTVEGKMVVTPSRLNFRVVDAQSTPSVKANIFARGLPEGQELVVAKIEPAYVTAQLQRDQIHKNLWRLTVKLAPKAENGSFKGLISIHDTADKPRLSIPVEGIVRGGVLPAEVSAATKSD